MLSKDKILETINAMPEEKFKDIEAVIEEIILLEKIENGLEALKKGNVISEEDVDREIEKW